MDAHRSDEHSVCFTQFFLAAYAMELIEASTITNVIFLSDFFHNLFLIFLCRKQTLYLYITLALM